MQRKQALPEALPSKQILLPDPTHTVSGNLTIKGITKKISFPAKINVDANAIDAIAKFNIDRTQWNIVYPGKPLPGLYCAGWYSLYVSN